MIVIWNLPIIAWIWPSDCVDHGAILDHWQCVTSLTVKLTVLLTLQLQHTFVMVAGKTMGPATWLPLLSVVNQWEPGDTASSTPAMVGSPAWGFCSLLMVPSMVAWGQCRQCWGSPVSLNPAIEISAQASQVPGHSISQLVVCNLHKYLEVTIFIVAPCVL